MSAWVSVFDLSEIPPLGARTVTLPEGRVAVFRTADDGVFAIEDKCPHKEGPLSQGIVHGNHVTCPLHNWVLDLATGSAVAPDVGCVKKFDVKLEGSSILLKVDALSAQSAA